MIGYLTLGESDVARGAAFYDAICGALGVSRLMESESFIAWGALGGGCSLGVTKPFDGKPASVGNGVMAALACKDAAQVDAIHALALSMGGADEGAPGPRPGPPGFYAGYFRDPAGNKLNAYIMGEKKMPPPVGYVTLGSNDVARAGAFYDPIAQVLGAARIFEAPGSIVWGGGAGAEFDITTPFDGKPATVGNGVMAALQCRDRAQVDAIHALALAGGGVDEGAPGARGYLPGFYAGYFRDLDGNKLNAFTLG